MKIRKVPALLSLFGFSACTKAKHQSMLHPAGDAARIMEENFWVLTWGGTLIFLITLVLLAMALIRGTRDRPRLALGPKFVIWVGALLPGVILLALLVYTISTTIQLQPNRYSGADPIHIRVTGYQWWWEVVYPDEDLITANEIYIPTDRPIRLELQSNDVIHSLWVPNLHGKMDMIPGQKTQLWLRADEAGIYRGQCAEFCGIQHALMAFLVVALPESEFREWIQNRKRPQPAPTDPELLRGRAVFFEAGCNGCHAIRGTEADGRIGPDLTHIGSRLTLGAGTTPNRRGHLTGWIANSQAVKPGNLMPPSHVDSKDLLALTTYLESLK